MVSFILLTIGLIFVGLGIAALHFTKEPQSDTWLWVGHGEDPFKVKN